MASKDSQSKEQQKDTNAQRVLHTVRTRDGGKRMLKITRKTAIKIFCTECLGWEHHPDDCTSPLCPLFPFRGRTEATLMGNVEESQKEA